MIYAVISLVHVLSICCFSVFGYLMSCLFSAPHMHTLPLQATSLCVSGNSSAPHGRCLCQHDCGMCISHARCLSPLGAQNVHTQLAQPIQHTDSISHTAVLTRHCLEGVGNRLPFWKHLRPVPSSFTSLGIYCILRS